jgi:hypothetical protein
MSLAIDVDAVTHVLLSDGWHVVHKASFDLDAYEYIDEGNRVYGGGDHPTVPHTGARWIEGDGAEIVCPLTSILAVRRGKIAAKAK